jgi:hypothetical protein
MRPQGTCCVWRDGHHAGSDISANNGETLRRGAQRDLMTATKTTDALDPQTAPIGSDFTGSRKAFSE